MDLQVSLASAIGGAITAFLAWAWLSSATCLLAVPTVLTFRRSELRRRAACFAFLRRWARTGFVTILLNGLASTSMRQVSTCLFGLTLTHLFSRYRWMVLILTPAPRRLKKSGVHLQATTAQYWRIVALFRILWPSLLGTTLLLFANAFGAAIATAYAFDGFLSSTSCRSCSFAQIRVAMPA